MKSFEIVYGDCGAGKTTEIARRVKSLALNRAEEGLTGFENRIYSWCNSGEAAVR